MINITTKMLSNLWKSRAGDRIDAVARRKYYDGKNTFLSKLTNADGSMKSDVPINWPRYIVDSHTSASMTVPITYVTDQTEELNEIIDNNDLNTADTEHFREAMITGSSIEVHSTDENQNIKITQFNSENWLILENEDGEIVLAIYEEIIPANSVYNDTYYEKKTVRYHVYDDVYVTIYKPNEKNEWSTEKYAEHLYGQVPVAVFSLNEDEESSLNDNLLGLCNMYSSNFNARNDTIQFNSSSFMVLRGFDPEAKDLDRLVGMMRQNRLAILEDPAAGVDFLEKGTDQSNMTNDALSQTLDNILALAYVPKLDDISAGSNVSGATLRMLYMPMSQAASRSWSYYRRGLAKRIELINIVQNLLDRPEIIVEDYIFTFVLPIDVLAERTSVAQLSALLSDRTLIQLLPDNINPDKELERKEEEGSNNNGINI